MNNVIGIDPGLNGGYAVLEPMEDKTGFKLITGGSYAPPKTKGFKEAMRDADNKLQWVRNRAVEVVTLNAHSGTIFGIEKPFIPSKQEKEIICPAYLQFEDDDDLQGFIDDKPRIVRIGEREDKKDPRYSAITCPIEPKRETIGNPYHIMQMGETVGIWTGMARTVTKNIYKIAPQTWQKTHGRPRGAGKDWAVEYLKQKYKMKLLKKDHNFAEAILIALHIGSVILEIPAVLKDGIPEG